MKPKYDRVYGHLTEFLLHMDGVDLYSYTITREHGTEPSTLAKWGNNSEEMIGSWWFLQDLPPLYAEDCRRIPESVKQWTRAYLSLIR